MNKLFIIGIFMLDALVAIGQTSGIQQETDLYTDSAGHKFFRWYGHSGRNYFLQISDPNDHLCKWNWATIIEKGNDQLISYEVDGTADKGFFRLKYTTAQPNLGETLESADFDNDGISNIDEIDPQGTFGQTDPLNPDSDGDSLLDGWEIMYGLDPTDDGSVNPDNGAVGDKDGDGRPNFKEQEDGTAPDNASDFESEFIWATNKVSGLTFYSTDEPEEGYISYQPWNFAAMSTKGLSATLEPTTLNDELAGLTFPATALNAVADLSGGGHRRDVAVGFLSDEPADFYRTPEIEGYSASSGQFSKSRVWLHLPPAPMERELPFLKITKKIQKGYYSSTEVKSSELEVVKFSVPLGEAYSLPLDLTTTAPAIEGRTYAIVELKQISIVPGENMAGVVGDVVKPLVKYSFVKHFVTPRATTDIDQDYVILKAEGIESSMFSQVLEWEGGEPGPTDETRKVSRSAAGSTEVKIKAKTGGAEVAKMIVWVVWADVAITKGSATFSQYPNGAGVKYEASNVNGSPWRFVFNIKPAKLFDLTVVDRPDLQGERGKPAPGAGARHFLNTLGPGDDVKRKWDVSRQVQFTIRNPNGVDTQGMTPAELYANQPREESVAVAFPMSDVAGNDDPPNNDEDGNPYSSNFLGTNLTHEMGEISSYDNPSLSVPASNSSSAAFFSKEYDFREFARLEIWDEKRKSGKFWYRISELKSWHHHLRTTFNELTNQWEDTGSSSDVN